MNTEDSEFKRLEHEALLRASQPEHHPQHSHTLQERLEELHLYEEINQHYAKCNAGAENLRDWVAERMDKESEQPVQPAKPPQRPWVGLTDDELLDIADLAYANDLELMHQVQAKLKEKNQ